MKPLDWYSLPLFPTSDLRDQREGACGDTVLVPEMFGQSVEERCHLSKPAINVSPDTEDWQSPCVLEAGYLPLRHISVHEQIKPAVLRKNYFDFPISSLLYSR